MSTPTTLDWKLVIITWWTSWIWEATVKAFATQWATVHFTWRNQEAWDRIANEHWATFTKLDATDYASTKEYIERLWKEHGTIHTLFLNAWSAKAADILETTEELYDFTYNLNVKSPILSIQYALPYLKEGSVVTITASVAWQAGYRGFNIYGSTKAAMINIAQTYAAWLAERGARINTISPGPIDTDIFSAAWIPDEHVQGAKDQMGWMTALWRMGHADEIAETVVFLSSPAASYITWTDIVVDGGMLAKKA